MWAIYVALGGVVGVLGTVTAFCGFCGVHLRRHFKRPRR